VPRYKIKEHIVYMHMKEFSIQFFQLSKEKVRCPLIPEVIRFGKELKGKIGIISVRYGKRMLSILSPTLLDEITEDEFVEVIDYDPVKNSLMFIGEHQPDMLLAVHWIVLRAREDINIIVHLYDGKDILNPLERAKKILSSVKGDRYIFNDKNEVLFLGKSFVEIIERIGRN